MPPNALQGQRLIFFDDAVNLYVHLSARPSVLISYIITTFTVPSIRPDAVLVFFRLEIPADYNKLIRNFSIKK